MVVLLNNFFTTFTAMSKYLIVKDNALINASYNLNLIEQRLILLVVGQAKRFNQVIQADTRLEIKVSDYMDVYSVQGRSVYENIKDACKTLLERQFTYHEKQEKGIRVATSKWVSEIAYNDETGAVDLTFAPAVISLISLLEKHFTSYDLEQVAGLNSKYAVRLYEIVIAWRSQGKTPQIKVKELREQLGVSDDEYTLMETFKRRVLDLAVKEISKHTNITLEYTQHKNGRKIVGFTFEFKYKKGREPKNQDTISLAKGEIYNGIATEPKPLPQLTTPKQPLIPPLELEGPTPQAVNAELELTELERIAIAEVCAYADKIGATPSHRQNLIDKALKEIKEQAKIQEQAKDLATAQKQAKEQALQAMAQKQQQKEQAFDEFWARASLDEKRVIYEYVAKRAVGNYHIQEFNKALETGDFSTVQDPFFTHHELMRPLFIAGYDVFTKNQTPMPNKAH